MSNQSFKVLILEDDATLASAMSEAFQRAGHVPFVANRAEDALSTLSTNRIDFLFVDCLLPGTAGPDAVLRIYEQFPASKFKVILMSGVFVDKSFVSEAVSKTKAEGFLQKPFNIQDALKYLTVKEEVTLQASTNLNLRKKLYGIFSDPDITARKKRKVIEEIEEISGYDLPFVYSLLVETASSGNFFIYYPNKSVSSITFCQGHIVGVDIEDNTTFLGEMLIQSGYALPNDVQMALSMKKERRLGEYLIQANQLSPHAFEFILEEQMNLRLARTITSEKVKINFAAAETEMAHPNIDSEILLSFLHDWIASKIPTAWLKNLYINWSSNPIVLSKNFSEDHPALKMSLVETTDGLISEIKKESTLSKILSHKKFNEDAVYKALHFLLTRGLIVFKERESFKSRDEQLVALTNILSQIDGKTPFEIYQFIESSTVSAGDPQQSLSEFVSILGEMPSDKDVDLYRVYNEIYRRATEAFSVAQDSQQRAVLAVASQKAEAEKKLKANALFEEGRKLLEKGSSQKALGLLSEAYALNPTAYQIHLMLAWAKVGLVEKEEGQKKLIQLKDVEIEMTQVSPDEKYDSLFPFVMGLYSKARGDLNSAKRSFQKSIAIDSSFLPAKRELSLLESGKGKGDLLKMDLKDVVSGFFKKR
ncbi:MAG: response regulator [Bdellovibrionia bacterium]